MKWCSKQEKKALPVKATLTCTAHTTHSLDRAVAAEGAEACCLLTHTVSVCCSQQHSEPYVNTYYTRTSGDYLLCVCIRIPVTKRKKKEKKEQPLLHPVTAFFLVKYNVSEQLLY